MRANSPTSSPARATVPNDVCPARGKRLDRVNAMSASDRHSESLDGLTTCTIRKKKVAFNIPESTMVVTRVDVTRDACPVLEVSHEDDGQGGSLWQSHSGDGNHSPDRLELVRLETVLKLDPGLNAVADLPMGRTARRRAVGDPWIVS